MADLVNILVEPVHDSTAQAATLVVLALTMLDVIAGSLSAHLHDEFSSHKFRDGIIKKMQNLLLLVAALFVDVALLSGLNLPMSPCYLGICAALILMEIKSMLEIWNKDHPEVSGTIEHVFGVDEIGNDEQTGD